MLAFITYIDAPEEVEIVADETGFNELIQYLQSVKNNKDHMHLVIDTELSPYPIAEIREGKTLYAKHVRIEFFKPD